MFLRSVEPRVLLAVRCQYGSSQKDVSDYSYSFETTTLPAQACRRLFVELKVETLD